MKHVELQIIGFTNLNNFYESLDESKIDDFSEHCEHREENQENNIYNIQYIITE